MNREEQKERLANRDPRAVLSKSFMTGADMCGERAWRDLNFPRPFVMTEQVLFGKAVDAGVAILIDTNNKHAKADLALAKHEAEVEMMEFDEDIWPDYEEVDAALEAFVPVIDKLDLDNAVTQPHIRVSIPGIPMPVDAHPDLIAFDDRIIDIKTSKRSKEANAARNSYTELGFYAIAHEQVTGRRVPSVGYLTWVRSKSPYWQYVEAEVTDEMRARALARARGFAWAIRTDADVNREAAVPANVSFVNGPRFAGLCGGCAHNPSKGGGCGIYEEENQ